MQHMNQKKILVFEKKISPFRKLSQYALTGTVSSPQPSGIILRPENRKDGSDLDNFRTKRSELGRPCSNGKTRKSRAKLIDSFLVGANEPAGARKCAVLCG